MGGLTKCLKKISMAKHDVAIILGAEEAAITQDDADMLDLIVVTTTGDLLT